MREIAIWHNAKYGMNLESPYSKEFLDELRLTVPGNERRWNDKLKQWWISDIYLDEVDNLLLSHFGHRGLGRKD